MVLITDEFGNESNPVMEATEFETFQHFLGKDDWIPDDVNSLETAKKSKKKTRVRSQLLARI